MVGPRHSLFPPACGDGGAVFSRMIFAKPDSCVYLFHFKFRLGSLLKFAAARNAWEMRRPITLYICTVESHSVKMWIQYLNRKWYSISTTPIPALLLSHVNYILSYTCDFLLKFQKMHFWFWRLFLCFFFDKYIETHSVINHHCVCLLFAVYFIICCFFVSFIIQSTISRVSIA